MEGGSPLLSRAPQRCCSSGQTPRAPKGPPCPGSPCKEGSRCCSHWTGREGEGARRGGAPCGGVPSSEGAAGVGCDLEGSGCCHSESPRSSGAGGGRREAARGCRSLPAASFARTRQPTAEGRAAPWGAGGQGRKERTS